MITTSVAVQAPSAASSNSIGPGPVLDSRSESSSREFPEGVDAAKLSPPCHRIVAVCMDAFVAQTDPECPWVGAWQKGRSKQRPYGCQFREGAASSAPTGANSERAQQAAPLRVPI